MSKQDTTKSSKQPTFYKLDYANLPDELFQADVPAEKWLDTCEVCYDTKGFPANSLNKVHPIAWDVHVERLVGIALYMMMNVFPFLIIPLLVLRFVVATPWAIFVSKFVVVYFGGLAGLEMAVFQPYFNRKYRQHNYMKASTDQHKQNQYVFTERNTNKYLSTSFVWPASLPSIVKDKSCLFCMVPHGVAPFGITAYPVWSKVFNARLTRWTSAPVVLQIPGVGYLLKKLGYIPAKANAIQQTLTSTHPANAGVILDGIAGMFHQNVQHETAYLQKRKGIVKIALKAGVPIVPVYGFGHTALYTVVVDPFGILEKLSNTLQASLTPFLGRWGWLLGPPRRVAVTVCLGNPVVCPQTDEPTQQQIDEYHGKLLEEFNNVFEQHKTAYGWPDKELHFV